MRLCVELGSFQSECLIVLQIHFTSSESAIQAHVSRITELQSQLAESHEAGSAIARQRADLESRLAELTAQLAELVVDGEKNKVCINCPRL